MHNITIQDVGILFAVIASILGWAYQLGYSGARLSRNEKDIAELKAKADQCNSDHERDDKELRAYIQEGFQRLYDKIDKLPCHNPKGCD